LLSYVDPGVGLYMPCLRSYMKHFYGPGFLKERVQQKYLDHLAEVRALVPKDKYLEFNVKDGWAPLCNFQEKQVPDKLFPRLNDRETFNDTFGPFFRDLMIKRLAQWAALAVGACSMGVGIWWSLRI